MHRRGGTLAACDATVTLDDATPAATFTCPAGCTDSVDPVATGIYALTTPACQAAVDAGLLTAAGGDIRLYYTKNGADDAFRFTPPGGYFFRLDIPVDSLDCDANGAPCGKGRYASIGLQHGENGQVAHVHL